MTWTQNYTPIGGHLVPSTLVAAIPVVIVLGLLAFGHARAHWAALAGLAVSLLIAVFIYRMPAQLAGLAALDGAAYGLFPIGWIVLCAIFIYDITVFTGQFEVIKHSIAGLAEDRRIQVLLIAFSFGAFIEGAAGFGTPVAISAAMLIGLGFRPLQAAGLALIGNTAPVAFGSLGTPVIALAKVSGLPLHLISIMVGRQLPFFSAIIPFWLVWAMCGWRKMLEVWPACIVAGVSFGFLQFAVSNFHGPWVVDMAASIASILSLVVLLQFWQPKTVWRFDHESERASAAAPSPSDELRRPSAGQTLRGWMPWIVLSVVVFTWGLPQVKQVLEGPRSVIRYQIPILHKAVFRAPPVVKINAAPEDAVFVLNWLSATGTSLLVTGIISGLLLGLSPMTLVRLFGKTVYRVRYSLLTIGAMLALGFTTRYAGIDSTMGLAFASTGKLFPFFSPLLGWLGVALTGSDTASNVLFGNLQQVTAQQVGVSPLLAAASNSSGGVMGKMIDAQSIVVASVATGQEGSEGEILRYVFFHSIALAILVGILVMLQAHVLRGMVPAL